MGLQPAHESKGASAVERTPFRGGRQHLQWSPGCARIRDPADDSRAVVAYQRDKPLLVPPVDVPCHSEGVGRRPHSPLPPDRFEVARRHRPNHALAEGPTCRAGLRPQTTWCHSSSTDALALSSRRATDDRAVGGRPDEDSGPDDDWVAVDDHQARGQGDGGGLSSRPVNVSSCVAGLATPRGGQALPLWPHRPARLSGWPRHFPRVPRQPRAVRRSQWRTARRVRPTRPAESPATPGP